MEYLYEDDGTRAKCLKNIRRVVIKIGTRLLMDIDGVSPDQRAAQLIHQIDALRKRGMEVVLVTSGAIGAGLLTMNLGRRPTRMAALQALGAVGQCDLMRFYGEACMARGFHCAQLLLTAADLHDRERHVKVAQCIEELLAMKVLPVINENDSVCVDEIKIGDNDTLATLVASMCRADLTILLTTVNGLQEREEQTGKLTRRISLVQEMSGELMKLAGGTDGNRFSVGGMATKLRAAAMTTCCGDPMWIADGSSFGILERMFAGEDVGTLFLPTRKIRLHARQRYLAFFAAPQGDVVVDSGAEKALLHQGRSLLPGGVLGLRGSFGRGSTVRIVNPQHQELGKGVVNYSSEELSRICGCSVAELETVLGYQPAAEEVIHRNAMTLLGAEAAGEKA